MSLTAKEVSDKISEYEDSQDYEDQGYGNFYHYVKSEGRGWGKDAEVKDIEVPGLPTIRLVDEYGGEGSGDEFWVVFSVGDQYFRVDGWYASYDGGELDGEVYEVFPHEVTSTVYTKEK